MDRGIMAFLFGGGAGFLENQMVTCPGCGAEFPIEDTRLIKGKPACPECFEPVDEQESEGFDGSRRNTRLLTEEDESSW